MENDNELTNEIPETGDETPEEENKIETAFYTALTMILKDFPPENIRFSYQDKGQPSFSSSEDVIFLNIIETDSEFGKENEIIEKYNSETDTVERIRQRTIVYKVNFIVYGQKGNLYVNKIRNGFFLQEVKQYLGEHNLYIIPNFGKANFLPEMSNGGWYIRHDFSTEWNYLWTSPVEELDYISQVEINAKGE